MGKGLDHEQGVIDVGGIQRCALDPCDRRIFQLQYFDVIIKLGSQHHLHDSGKMILKYLNPANPSYDAYGPIGSPIVLWSHTAELIFVFYVVQLVYQRVFKEALAKLDANKSSKYSTTS